MRRTLSTIGLTFILGTLISHSGAAEDRVVLKGHIPKEIQNATKLERVPADEQVGLGLVLQLDQTLLDQTLNQLYGKNAPATKHFLTPSEFAQKFGMADKRQKLK